MEAGHCRWKTLQAKRLAETGDGLEHPDDELGRVGAEGVVDW